MLSFNCQECFPHILLFLSYTATGAAIVLLPIRYVFMRRNEVFMEMKQQFFKHTSVNRTFFIMVLIAALLTGLFAPAMVRHSGAASPFIILSSYRSSLKIGQEMVLSAVTSDLSYPSFTSSASSIASVNVYGVITAKKPAPARSKSNPVNPKPIVRFKSFQRQSPSTKRHFHWKSSRHSN